LSERQLPDDQTTHLHAHIFLQCPVRDSGAADALNIRRRHSAMPGQVEQPTLNIENRIEEAVRPFLFTSEFTVHHLPLVFQR
jgi:hypothetical protein